MMLPLVQMAVVQPQSALCSHKGLRCTKTCCKTESYGNEFCAPGHPGDETNAIDLQEMNWKFQAGFHEHTGVSLQHTCSTTHEEETPVCLRIQRSRATVKERHTRLQQAYQRDNVRLVRRLTVVLALLVHRVPMAVFCQRWGLSPSSLSAWQQALRLRR